VSALAASRDVMQQELRDPLGGQATESPRRVRTGPPALSRRTALRVVGARNEPAPLGALLKAEDDRHRPEGDGDDRKLEDRHALTIGALASTAR
jgi:hypothetical protein